MKTQMHLLLWMLMAANLVGCGSALTSDQPAEHVYWLRAVNLQSGEPPAGERPELVVSVRAIPGLDTDRILIMEPGQRLNYYAGARWPDHLPEVMSAVVRLSLESSGRFSRVSTRSRVAGTELALELELRKFFTIAATAGNPSQAHVELVGYLNCGSNSATVSAAATAPAQQDKLSEIVAAFQYATDEAMTRLGEQVGARCE